MRFISTRTHGILDYVMGALLILAPFILGFAVGAAMWVPIIIGAGVILYSLSTDYEYSISRSLPMSTHLLLDVCGGILLAASPWLFGFSDLIWWPHLVFGLAEVGAGLMTHTRPDSARVPEHVHA